MKHIESKEQLELILTQESRTFIMLYRSGYKQSECAVKNADYATYAKDKISLYALNLEENSELESLFNKYKAPTLLEYQNGKLAENTEGCQTPDLYLTLFEEKEKLIEDTQIIEIYSSPNCPWCKTLKDYLFSNNILFTDVDISLDPEAMKTLVMESGHKGVPQTKIGNQFVIGFDKNKLNALLNIKE